VASVRKGWARNPYALVEAALDTSLDWGVLEATQRLGPTLALKLRTSRYDALVRSATGANPVPTILHLFDRMPVPGFDSVRSALAEVEKTYPDARTVIDAFRQDDDGRRILDRIVPLLTSIGRGGRGAASHLTGDDAPGGTPHAVGSPPPSQIDWQARGPRGAEFTAVEGMPAVDFRDPVQGVIGDCYLVAAISAVAWTDPQGWGNRVLTAVAPGGAADCQFEFNRLALPRKWMPRSVTRKLPFVASGAIPYTRSRTATESWPTLYEKAYLKWVEPFILGEPSANDYQRLDQRTFPHAACAQLMGLGWSGNTGNMTFSLVVDAVRQHCTPPTQPVGADYTSSVSHVPLTAWTFDGDDRKYPTVENEFTVESQLVADHAYAVLGWCGNAAGEKWILVRNPWGRNPVHAGYFKGTQGASANERLWLTGRNEPSLAEVRLNDDGVFGVPAALFSKCFKAVAWAP
jgi:hypothetical protein